SAIGDTIISYSSPSKDKDYLIKPKKGMNKFNWNLRYKPAKQFEGMILWAGDLGGPVALPGKYSVEFNFNDQITRKSFSVLPDPRSKATPQDYAGYFDFVTGVRNKITEAHEVIITIRDIRQQLNNYKERVLNDDELKKEIRKIDSTMTLIEEALYQTKTKSGQDVLNFPVRLTNKIAYLNNILGNGDYPPTEQAYAVKEELEIEINVQLTSFEKVKNKMIPAFNQMVRDKGIDAIILKKEKKELKP
ncbi:MAG: glycosyl hydrolase, partial [Saprospiraceae bacterium]